LLYLTRETRTNTNALEAAAERQASWGFSDIKMQLARDPDLARILRQSMEREMGEWAYSIGSASCCSRGRK
jgi:hypothetical protein